MITRTTRLRFPKLRLNSHLLLKTSLLSFSSTITYHKSTPQHITKRYQSSATLPNKIDPELLLQFTCNICNNRSSHHISKQAYDHGTVLVQCPSCKSRHLIADNLGFIEYNKKFNLQDYLNSKGQSIETNPNVIEFKDIPEDLRTTVDQIASDAPPEDTQSEILDLPKPTPEEQKKG
ncbi:ZIM17 Mitochondrial protein import protein ZIM17 [Candida maltosa Xu316]|uniref:DNL-type domain-containing protein n=1 Tax=Candida maltosa (strain Xu316) TaxID=1245528 RepID=M3J5E6_CANMX|nr:hypothetical protein G210_2410 [Candida maltosa Xu316]